MDLPFGLSAGAAAFLAFAVLGAAFVRGYSGFGFSALVIAAAGLMTSPLHFVAVATVWELLMSVQAWRGVWRDVDWRRVRLLIGGAAVGLPFGLWALTSIPEDAARAAISGYVLLMCAVLVAGWRMAGEAGRAATAAVGVVSGAANAPGMGGLPVAAFFAAQPMRAQVFRATLVAYFPLLDVGSAPLYWWHGLITRDTGLAAALGLPLVLAGNWLGGRHFFQTDPQEFRRFAILLLAGLAALGLVKSVM
ncbi:sulfite exporter TauE/SafE family protein [Albidovulum sp.]|uniref:sulfite exporter TauE/SafE family protein n=1 Tax=Albidovulum sp. TaxID=1872424 RepID=UPI0039B82C31